MTKKALVLLFLLLVVGCAITTVEYRYKERFDHFYQLLNDQEKKVFCADDFLSLGKSLEMRIKQDESLAKAIDTVMFDEAIHTFRLDQVGYFFKRYILTGFHQDDYDKFIKMMSKEMLLKFIAKDPSLIQDLNALRQKNHNFDRWWRSLLKDGRLGDFSPEEIVSFYRNYIFPERTHSQVYYVLSFLADKKLLKLFLTGGNEVFSQSNYFVQGFVAEREVAAVRERAGLSKLSYGEFFWVYREVIFQEMDREAFRKTLAKFPLE